MERAALLSRSELILLEHLPARVCASHTASGASPPSATSDTTRLEAIERQAILDMLRQHQSNRTDTAKALGISRRALLYKIQRFREQGYDIQ